MTTTLDAGAPTAQMPAPSRWRTIIVIALAMMAVAGTVVGIKAIVYVHTYQPLASGSFGGDRIGQAKDLTDGVTDPSAIILSGPPGSTGGVMQSIDNGGTHAVRILGPVPNSEIAVSWLPGYPDGSKSWATLLRSAHPFPMTIAPGEQIGVFMMVTKPNSCKGAEGIATTLSVELRTEAFGVHHDYNLAFGSDDGGVVSLVLCPERKQRQYVSPFLG